MMLDVLSLDYDYGDVPLISGLDIHINEGEIVHLRGENGTGKSTVLKMLCGLKRPQSGHILFYQKELYEHLKSIMPMLAYLGHQNGLHHQLTVFENLAMNPVAYSKEDILSWLKYWSLVNVMHMPVSSLSAGQKRKAAMAGICLKKAKLWVLDEPFVALDTQSQSLMANAIDTHVNNGGTVVLTSHQPLPDWQRAIKVIDL